MEVRKKRSKFELREGGGDELEKVVKGEKVGWEKESEGRRVYIEISSWVGLG